MATPLADLLRAVLTDDTVRQAAGRSPSAFLQDHGWEHLDAADLREAMLVLADGSPSAEAVIWVEGGEAIDPDADLADALVAAAAALPADGASDLLADDPAGLDGDGDSDSDSPNDTADDADTAHGDGTGDDTGSSDDDDDTSSSSSSSDGDGDGDGALDVDTPLMPPDDARFVDVELDGPERFADPDDTQPDDDAPAPGEFGDGWDDLI